jgi:hypothetical protein
MSFILGLLIVCLGLYFLSLFFQVARLEKMMTESVTLLEKYMMVKHSLGDENKKKKPGEGEEPPPPDPALAGIPPLGQPPTGPRH